MNRFPTNAHSLIFFFMCMLHFTLLIIVQEASIWEHDPVIQIPARCFNKG